MSPLITTATPVPVSAAVLASSVDLITGADLARQQLSTLADALWQAPGGPSFSTGRMGASTSLFLRGANSDQVLFLVDGVRFSDANLAYGPFVGSYRTGPTDRIEIARGPQSTLYGADASGGVVSISIPQGTLNGGQSIGAEAGSFGTMQGDVSAQGALSGWAYNVGVTGGVTDNDRANNEFKSINGVLRLDHALTQNLAVGATVRALEAKYGDPGDIFTNDPTAHEKEQDLLGTVFLTAKEGQYFSEKITLGGQYRREDAWSFGADDVAREERGVLTGQVVGQVTANDRITSGFDLETGDASDSGFGAVDHHDTLAAVYAEDEYSPTKELFVTGGLREDDYSTYGSVTTGRVTLAALGASHLIKLRGSYGTGFNAPSFLDLYSRDPSFVGNPNLQPERSRGWDAGFDFYLPEDPSQVLSITYFHTNYTNLILDNFAASPATTYNAGTALTDGLEASWKTQLAGAVQTKLTYTYLVAEDTSDHTGLLRRPRDSGSADLYLDLKNGWTMGAGALLVGRRPDVDPVTFATIDDPSYSVVRVYARWQFNRHLGLHLRLENALNRAYEPVAGYPALPRGIFGGADWKF
jgi:vitamin B12 transporter